MDYLLLPTLSFLIGIIVGLTGIGGASLITPMLIFIFQVPPAVAVSSDIVAATMMKVVGGVKHWQQETLDCQVVKWLALGSVPGSLVGVGILYLIRQMGIANLDGVLLHLLGSMILVVVFLGLGQLIIKEFFPNFVLPELPKFDLNTNWGRMQAMGVGAILGSMVGMTSVSSGSLFAMALISFFQLDSRKLVGTDLAQAAILLSFTSLGHMFLGTVDWGLVIPIWFGTIPGVMVGAKLCQLMPPSILKFTIYTLLLGVSFKLVY
ncbi:sulfite exporter TauE/SafE family protein [Calothrix sp. 336/3]|uniref:sulfite exporter TauE/SafE family protein n=1 Tax=Calothrix sp. 336/3 TaxID=1337936 RepID=UPI0004E3000A|nr:sulfite exporter TauE/SafE family protein [Calothrix sp. 336/3]AKG20625.1 hypothetical protein IJ00_04200 [Calothrix sp. 336/3]